MNERLGHAIDRRFHLCGIMAAWCEKACNSAHIVFTRRESSLFVPESRMRSHPSVPFDALFSFGHVDWLGGGSNFKSALDSIRSVRADRSCCP